MTFDLVHVSDLHFGDPSAHLRRREFGAALSSILSQIHSPATSFLIISGDIILKGNKEGYREAAEIITSVIKRHQLPQGNVLVCPGNHDIVQEQGGRPFFTSFDAWSSGLRSDKRCTFAEEPVQLIQNETGDFLLLNTAYKADYTMGLVDLPALTKLLDTLPTQGAGSAHRLRVAIAHHHFIPVLHDDTSTTRNAYCVIGLLEKFGFSALLHGHQHAMLKLNVGQSNMLLSGVGSFSYQTPGYMNTAAIYRCQGGAIEAVEYYGLTLDSSGGIVKILHPN